MSSTRQLKPAGEAGANEHPLTIEQLAASSGLSVRNIRSHQARGLLQPPQVRRRVGYYGEEHLDRLRAIAELQAQGLNLKAVKQMLDDTEGTVQRLLSLRRSLAEPVSVEQSEVLTEAELDEQLGDEPDRARLLSKLEDLGFVVSIGAGHYEIPSPSLLEALGEARRHGISSHHVAELADAASRHSESVARRLVKNFIDDIWKPFLQRDAPEADWPAVAAAIERLRPLGTRAIAAAFEQTISRRMEETLGDATKRLSERKH